MDIYSDLVKKQREFAKCAQDVFYFATNYVHTLDQQRGKRALYPAWDYLQDIFTIIDQPGDLFLEKSRDMLISWTVMVYFLWSMLFKDSWAGFAISRKQAEVDDGGDNSTPESLFGRIKYMHSYLPPWMKPEFRFSLLKIRNIEGDSYCTGESANPNSGRNVACTFKFCDEFAFLPINDQESINKAMRFGSYRTLLYATTAEPGTLAEKISKQGMGFEKIQVPWHLHPHKDQNWYKQKTAGSDEADVASELNISYSPTDEARIVAQFWDEEEGILEPTEFPRVDAYEQIVCGIDYGFLRTAVELAGLHSKVWHIFAELYELQKTTAEIADLVDGLRRSLGIDFHVFCGKDRPDLVKDFKTRGFAVTSFQEPVGVRIGTLITVFKARRIRVSSQARGLLAEILTYRRHSIGGVLVEAPHRHNTDEAMDALGYLLMGAGEESNSDLWVSEWSRTNPGAGWVSDDWSSDFSRLRWVYER